MNRNLNDTGPCHANTSLQTAFVWGHWNTQIVLQFWLYSHGIKVSGDCMCMSHNPGNGFNSNSQLETGSVCIIITEKASNDWKLHISSGECASVEIWGQYAIFPKYVWRLCVHSCWPGKYMVNGNHLWNTVIECNRPLSVQFMVHLCLMTRVLSKATQDRGQLQGNSTARAQQAENTGT